MIPENDFTYKYGREGSINREAEESSNWVFKKRKEKKKKKLVR